MTDYSSAVPAVNGAMLAASAACVFDLPEEVTIDVRRSAIRDLLAAVHLADKRDCEAIAVAIDVRLEAFCRTVRSPLVRAWLCTETSFVEDAFHIAAFAPVIEAEKGFEFEHRIFFSLLLSRVSPAGHA